MVDRVVFLSGFSHMRAERIRWIADFLSLFQPNVERVLKQATIRLSVDPDKEGPTGFSSGDLVVGHELPATFMERLSQDGIRYIDIRVSPVRFCSHDNLLALASNDEIISNALLTFRVSDDDLLLEARSLKLSFRYRDLGQLGIRDRALIVFTEQTADQDSILYKSPPSMRQYEHDLALLRTTYPNAYYVHRGDDKHDDPALLRDLGFERCEANIYAILSSSHVEAIAAIGSGVLEEARFFGVKVIALGSVTTRLATDDRTTTDNRFINIMPTDVLSDSFWSEILSETDRDTHRHLPRRVPHRNLIRRALNNWNSSATGLVLDSQPWRELVQSPIEQAVRRVQEDVTPHLDRAGPQPDRQISTLMGEWLWFTGEIVTIDGSGTVSSAVDQGLLERGPDGPIINWQGRQLTDALSVAPDGQSFVTCNQYGDGGTVRLVGT